MSSPRTTDRFKPYLSSDEDILWTGQPKQGVMFTGKDIFLVPFTLLWGGFALFWNVTVWMIPDAGEGAAWFMRLWGLPFLCVGLYMIAGRFIHDAMIRKTLFYAVSNQRILILRGRKLTSMEIRRLPKLELSERGDGTGSITFEGNWFTAAFAMNGFGAWLPALNGAQFLQIEKPRHVYDLIRTQDRSF
ncbi:hypothetical protein [Brevundimonas huaxiensis]|uniref:hypothetical protein n=1 Tax=Brevundimonas huaxiensis TaxID=2725493 RepID=UPI001966463C|nr:hypothetical protein [Brevundimonas huaxiensis]